VHSDVRSSCFAPTQAASDVYSPVSGTVLETNSKLSDEPALVNSSPFGDAWMMKVKISNAGEVAKLLDAKAYSAHCEAGGH
jgi:glycine cleavage system H protein